MRWEKGSPASGCLTSRVRVTTALGEMVGKAMWVPKVLKVLLMPVMVENGPMAALGAGQEWRSGGLPPAPDWLSCGPAPPPAKPGSVTIAR